MAKLRSRLFIIGGLVLLSVWALIPADTTQRVRDATTGRMKDTTIRRVPLNLGLDLQGGIHLALEVDQSKGPVPDPARSEEHTSELQSHSDLVCRLLLEKKNKKA